MRIPKTQDEKRIENMQRVADVLKNTYDSERTRLSEPEIKAYFDTFTRYMEATEFNPRVHNVVKHRPGSRLQKFASYVTSLLLVTLIIAMISITIAVVTTSDLDVITKIAVALGNAAISIFFMGIILKLWGRINLHLIDYADWRDIKVGDLYFYDKDCEYYSHYIYDPVVVQVISIIDRTHILGVDCKTRKYVAIPSPKYLKPFIQDTYNIAKANCIVRLPANIPIIDGDDITLIDACIVNARALGQKDLTMHLMDLRAKLVRYDCDPVCQDTADRFNALIDLMNDVDHAISEAKISGTSLEDVDPNVAKFVDGLRSVFGENGDVRFGIINGNGPMPDFLKDIFNHSDDDDESWEDDYE